MIKDIVQAEQISGVKFPKLHGHIKLTLTNAYSDNIEKVYEGDNLVTNAVKDIFANNVCGGIDYSKLYPLWQNWYGGILCYEQAHDSLDPDNYYPKNSSVNAVTAHAGQTVYTGADDMSRGSPLTDSQSLVFTEDSVKQTWEWGTAQGNGYIRAISLTHKDTGDAGLGVNSEAFQNFAPFENISGLSSLQSGYGQSSPINNLILTQYDDRHGLLFLIGDDGEFTFSNFNFSTQKITVYIVPLVYGKQGLLDNNVPIYTYMRKFTVTTSMTFYGMPAWYFDYTSKKLWLFCNKTNTGANYSTQNMNYTVIDCVNETEDSYGTIVSDASDLGITCVNQTSLGRAYPKFSQLVKDGNYVYFPMGTSATAVKSNYTGLKKINIASQADQSVFGTNTTSQDYPHFYYKCGGIIINGNRIFNGGVGYTCGVGAFSTLDLELSRPLFLQQANSPAMLAYVFNIGQSAEYPRYILAPKLLNTTLFNLDSVAQKLSSQRMTIEYTLTESNS